MRLPDMMDLNWFLIQDMDQETYRMKQDVLSAKLKQKIGCERNKFNIYTYMCMYINVCYRDILVKGPKSRRNPKP